MLLAEMAFNTGFSQSDLIKRFTAKELQEILIYKQLEFEKFSKEDARTQMMTYNIVNAIALFGFNGGSKASKSIKPDSFKLKWKEEPKKRTIKYNMNKYAEALAKIYPGARVTRELK